MHVQSNAVAPPTADLTTMLIDAAAALETRLHETEQQLQAITRELHWSHRRQADARRWIAAIRHMHRIGSHAKTNRLIAQAIADLDPAVPPSPSLFTLTAN